MRICIFSKTLSKGGAEKQSTMLASLLSDYHEVLLVTLFDNTYDDYLEMIKHKNVTYIRLKGNLIHKILAFKKILESYRIKILFCYLVSTNLIGWISGRLARVKNIIGGIRNSYHPPLKELILKLLHNYFLDYTISNNYNSITILGKKKFNTNKLIVIPNGIEIKNDFADRVNEDKIDILTVARFVTQKDYTTAISAFAKLLNYNSVINGKKIRYKIVGYGKLEDQLRNYAAELGVLEYIEFHGSQVSDKIYQEADIYLSTSLFEGTSNSILEAMNYALPIVTTDVGDNKYMVEDGNNGYLCEVKNSNEIAERLKELIEDHALRKKMGMESWKIVKKSYSTRVFCERYLNLIDKLESNEVKLKASA